MVAILGALAGSCAGFPLAGTVAPSGEEELQPRGDVQLDMDLRVNGKALRGMGVAPRADRYKIEGKAPDEFDVVTVTSCGRRVILSKPGDEFTLEFPIDGWLEGGDCAFLVEGLDKDKGKHSLGYFVVDDANLTLESTLHCNGEGAPGGAPGRGARACQTGAGVWLGLRFPVVVTAEPVEGCPIPAETGTEFSWRALPGHCTYLFFRGEGATREEMTLDVFGYRQAATWGAH